MFKVTLLLASGNAADITVPSKQTELRDLQKRICNAFGQSFPRMAATLNIGDKMYDEFGQVPFSEGPPPEPCYVIFSETDDPFFYDKSDRCGKVSLEDEMMGPPDAEVLPAIAHFPTVRK